MADHPTPAQPPAKAAADARQQAGAEADTAARDTRDDLPPAAQRALAEAEARRARSEGLHLAPELGGRDGPEPVRYGDWEKKGIAIDF